MQSFFSEFWIFIAFALIVFALKSAKSASKEKSFAPNTKEMNLDETEEAIKALLKADYEAQGYIIINDSKNNNFLQFAREKCGLLLNCPKAGVWENRLSCAKKLLESMGYIDINKPDAKKEDFDALKLKEFILSGDDVTGIYANVGDNSKEIKELTATLFKEMFGCTDFEHFRVEIVLRNR